MKNYISNRFVDEQRGFALIATITVMVLLVMIALAMLSLATLESRQTTESSHQLEAKANARMALMIALGDLQKSAGPDQIVTAPASIIGDTVVPEKKNWTTVWSTKDWDVQDPESSRDDDAYLATLVSQREKVSEGANRSEVLTELSNSDFESDPTWIQLVADGSVSETDDYVYAQTIELNGNSSNGSYAYWIGDEGVKARFDVGVSEDAASETWAAASRMGLSLGTGIHHMEEMDGYTDYLPGGGGEEDLDKFLDYRTIDLSSIGDSAVKKHFHNITTNHVGLLIDNRWGGIRRDLSTAFEMDIEDFGDIIEFSASEEVNRTDAYGGYIPSDLTSNPLYYSDDTDSALGFLYEIPVDSANRYRGPTWDVLRNHYRTYKKERNELNFRGLSSPSSDALVAHSVLPLSYNRRPGSLENLSLGSVHSAPHSDSTNPLVNYPIVSEHGVAGSYDSSDKGARNEPTVQKITPQLLRMVLQYGLARDGDDFYITVNPFFVLHNPYNYPIEFHSMGIDFSYMTALIAFEIQYKNSSGVSQLKEIFLADGSHTTQDQIFRIEAPGSGNHRLEPGEIRVASVSGGFQPTDDESYVIPMKMQFDLAGGAYIGGSVKTTIDDIPADEEITFKMYYSRYKSTTSGATAYKFQYQIPSLYVRLLHPLRADGAVHDLMDTADFEGNASTIHDRELSSLIQRVKITPEGATEVSATANSSSLPHPNVEGLAMVTLDMGLQDFTNGDTAVLSDFNYRSLAIDPGDYDKSHAIAPNWELSMSDTTVSELQLAGSDQQSGFWGEGKSSSDGGSSKIVLFDLPYAPMVSIGALQHADTSKFNLHAMRAIGHSRPQVGASDLTKIFDRHSPTRFSGTPSKYQFDTSWASNEAIWDRFFFSSISWGDADGQTYSSHDDVAAALMDGKVDEALVNSRMTLIETPTVLADVKDYTKIGEYLGVKGAFNVNSTSVEAWKAVLSSLSGREISYLDGTSLEVENIDDKLTPISRFSTPSGSINEEYTGFRALDESELNDLAEAIVEQVEARGPFMGLSDFVNRRLTSDDKGEMGALQAAIDGSGINSSVAMGSTSGNGLENSTPTASEGTALQITQGDILNLLGPVIATRSDTFVIRAYGDSKDASGNIRAKAWCEAVVQRTPKWVEDTDISSTIPNPNYPSENSTSEPILRQWQTNPNLTPAMENFGRRFVIKSFRWMSADEI